MRLADNEKGGYFPYPPHNTHPAASWFNPFQAITRGRLLNPCAGDDDIASLPGKPLACETWGCVLFSLTRFQTGEHRIINQGC